MANEVVINVRSENNVKPGFDAARADAIKLGNDIEKGFKDSGKRSGTSLAEGISAGVNDSGSGVGEKITRGVEEKLRDSKGRFRKSGEELGESLGGGTGVKFGKRFVDTIGGSFPEIGKRLGTEFKAIAAQAVPILATVGVAAAPLLGATLSAGIIGGAGIGGVIGGVMLAAKDPRVAAAGKNLGTTINSQLTRDATPFIQPTLNAIGMLQKAFDQNDSHIQNIFKNSARYVEPLTQGITGLISGLARGLDSLTSTAGPVIGAISKGLTQVGSSLGDAMTTISTQSDGAAKALGDVFGAISGIIQVIGPLLAGLTAVYGVLHDIGATESLFSTLLGPVGMLGDLFKKAGDSAEGASVGVWHEADSMTAAASASENLYANMMSTTASMDSLRASANALTDQNNALYSSTTNAAEAFANATKKIKDNGRTLDLNTEKGRANRTALSSVAQAARAQYEAFVKVNGVGAKSANMAENLRNKFVALATKATGSASAARKLADELLGIPSKRETKITANTAQALENAREVRRAIAAVQSKTVTLTVRSVVLKSNAVGDEAMHGGNMATGGIKGAASGATSSGLTWVGERGPELVSLAAGTRVHSAVDSARLTNSGHRPHTGGHEVGRMPALPGGWKSPLPTSPRGGGGGGSSGGTSGGTGDGSIYITLNLDGRQLVMAMVDPMRNFVRTSFGGSVQAAYGAGR